MMIRDKRICNFVTKSWGYERWIVNDQENNYCLKEMFVAAGKKCSIHYHKIKHETFYIIDGCLELATLDFLDFYGRTSTIKDKTRKESLESYGDSLFSYWNNFKTPFFPLPKGKIVSIEPYTPHQFYAKEDTKFMEVSTYHDEEDSYRIIPNEI